jgi:hypothetical protein
MEWHIRPTDTGSEVTWWYRAAGEGSDDLRPQAPLVGRMQAQQLGAFAAFARTQAGASAP